MQNNNQRLETIKFVEEEIEERIFKGTKRNGYLKRFKESLENMSDEEYEDSIRIQIINRMYRKEQELLSQGNKIAKISLKSRKSLQKMTDQEYMTPRTNNVTIRYKDVVQESSLFRVYTYVAAPDRQFGVISSYRHEMKEYEKDEAWEKLIEIVREKLRLGYIPCKGGYTETINGKEITVEENFMLIPKISKRKIIELGVLFKQENVIYKDKHEFSTIYTDKEHGVGKIAMTFDPSKGISVEDTKRIFSDFYSRLKKDSHRNKKFLFKEYIFRSARNRLAIKDGDLKYRDMFEGFEKFK